MYDWFKNIKLLIGAYGLFFGFLFSIVIISYFIIQIFDVESRYTSLIVLFVFISVIMFVKFLDDNFLNK